MGKCGLVLEGGAMRGLFTSGVLDVLLEHNVLFDGLVGVSAGASFGSNFVSRQAGRAFRYCKELASDWRFASFKSLFKTGDAYGAEFCYHTVPNSLYPFDVDTFNANPCRFFCVCTDVLSGKAVYHEVKEANDHAYEWLRASCSMPLASKVVNLDGHLLLDGGLTDSIPLAFSQNQGFERNLVILTQPLGFVKKSTPFQPLMNVVLHKYPKLLAASTHRHIMYNQELAFVAAQEALPNTLVIRPQVDVEIGAISHNVPAMERIYQQGRKQALQMLPQILGFVNR